MASTDGLVSPGSELGAVFDHESVEIFRDPATGLTGVVAIHSTALGPAMGGLRLRRYADLQDAVLDALRLARAMTLKNAAAGLDLGGGKAVLVDDGRWEAERPARLRAFGRIVDRLGGRYVTAEDVGTSAEDMDIIALETRWVVGRSVDRGGSGDPSEDTARTVLGAMAHAVRVRLGRDALDGTTVGVLGAGHVGSHLVRMLVASGASVLVSDVDPERAARCEGLGARAVELAGFVQRPLDVLAPCAMGELLSSADVPALRCRIIAGAANNPLIDRQTAVALDQAGILYVPDFIANCGGIVHVGAEFAGAGDAARDARIEDCIARAGAILEEAEAEGVLPLDVAVERARRRVAGAHESGE